MFTFGLVIAFIGYGFTRIVMQDMLYKYTQWLHGLPEWIAKPLGLCSVCFTGQLTLWLLLPLVQLEYKSIITYTGIIFINMTIVKLLTYVEKD